MGHDTGDPVECRADVVLGVVGGYLLGRTKRMKLALIMGSLAMSLQGRRPAAAVLPAASAAAGGDDIGRARTPETGLSTDRASDGAPADPGEFNNRVVATRQQVPENRVEDVNGSAVAETVAFGLDGRHYRLDLSRQDAATLREALAPFVAVARPSRRGGRNRRGRPRGERVPSSAASSDPNRNAAIREWARQHGHKLSKRGPIPASVLQMYKNDVG
jgi:hypothetical protein